jgi:GNAT superfamily N-acetyltransferase
MVQVTSRERVDSFWSATLGVDAVRFHTAGVHVIPNPPQRATWQGIYVLAFDQSACVIVPVDLREKVFAAVTGWEVSRLLQPDTWREDVGLTVRSAQGPVTHYYRDDLDGLDEHAAGRRIESFDAGALAELRAVVPGDEWASAGFGGETPVSFGLFDGDRLMAAANLTAGPDAATDIGIVVAPDSRGKGYGVRVTAAAARHAVITHGIARFRVLETSRSTMAIAETLRFEPYGRNLTGYLG